MKRGPTVHLAGRQSCTDTGQSSDPSGSDGACRAQWGFRRKTRQRIQQVCAVLKVIANIAHLMIQTDGSVYFVTFALMDRPASHDISESLLALTSPESIYVLVRVKSSRGSCCAKSAL